MEKVCPLYKCGCILQQCDPKRGICAAQGTAPITNKTKEGTATMLGNIDCPKTGKVCTMGACRNARSCQGDVCPTDGELCAMGKCVVHNKCHWHDYYGDMVGGDKRNQPITSDPKLAPATKLVLPELPLTGTASTAGGVKSWQRDCHKGMVRLQGGHYNVELYLGGRLDWLNANAFYDLTMHLTGGIILRNEPDVFEFNEAARALLPSHLLPAPRGARLAIDWPDYGVPAIAPTWWERFIVWLGSEAEGRPAEKPFKLAIHCEGGHGRTGTAAAIVAFKLGMSPEGQCPVEWLRSVYCGEVVESDEQVAYIEKCTGATVTADANSYFGNSWGFSKGGSGGWKSDYSWKGSATAAKPTVKVQATSKPVEPPLPKARDHIKDFDSVEAIRTAPGISKTRRKKLLRLWERGAKKLMGKG